MRCFIAIDLPDQVHRRLASLQEALKGCGWPVRWTNPDQIHLTIKFLGEVADDTLNDVCTSLKETCRGIPPFTLTIGSAGCFPPRGSPRVIWTGVLEPPAPLLALQERLDASLEAIGIPREARGFSPHLTLGRVKDRRFGGNVREMLREHEAFNAGQFEVDEVVIYQSELTPQGPIYTAVARSPLAGTDHTR